jgi:hypothetical protein
MVRLQASLALAMIASACATSPIISANAGWSYGCSPQAPADFQLAAADATGTLEVTLESSSGASVADKEVTASYTAYTGYKCATKVTARTGADGVARFERMRPGPYSIAVQEANKPAATGQVEGGQTASVTLGLD